MNQIKTILVHEGGPEDASEVTFEGEITRLDRANGINGITTYIRRMVWEPGHHQGPMYVCHETKVI